MKELLIRLLLGFLSFLMIYLLGSFGNAGFNISYWDEDYRMFTAIIGGFISILIMIAPNYNIK